MSCMLRPPWSDRFRLALTYAAYIPTHLLSLYFCICRMCVWICTVFVYAICMLYCICPCLCVCSGEKRNCRPLPRLSLSEPWPANDCRQEWRVRVACGVPPRVCPRADGPLGKRMQWDTIPSAQAALAAREETAPPSGGDSCPSSAAPQALRPSSA